MIVAPLPCSVRLFRFMNNSVPSTRNIAPFGNAIVALSGTDKKNALSEAVTSDVPVASMVTGTANRLPVVESDDRAGAAAD